LQVSFLHLWRFDLLNDEQFSFRQAGVTAGGAYPQVQCGNGEEGSPRLMAVICSAARRGVVILAGMCSFAHALWEIYSITLEGTAFTFAPNFFFNNGAKTGRADAGSR
jgi:hypothetical protein